MDQYSRKTLSEKIENPRDKKFLKYCFVCSEEAKPGKEHLKNYGGIVCFSCRAFWRRSHQATKNPVLYCKKGNSCELTIESRRHCKKCRYQRCLLAGMKPEAVLDLEQKKVHFRKYYSKQEKLSKPRKKLLELEGGVKTCRRSLRLAPSLSSDQPPGPQPKMVKLPPRTPERRNHDDAFPINLDFKDESYWLEQDLGGYEVCLDPANFSTFDTANFQSSCSFGYNYESVAQDSVIDNGCQTRLQLPDPETAHNDPLFYWNSTDFVN